MKQSRMIMGMPISVEIVDSGVTGEVFDAVFAYFTAVDERFSTYKETSEITAINRGTIREQDYSADMREVLALCEQTKQQTKGYFDIRARDGSLDPSGLVKGWSIQHAVELLKKTGVQNFFIDAGGDIAVNGKNEDHEAWKVGIRNPFNVHEIVKIVYLRDQGIATSGTYIRGQHIYDPFSKNVPLTEIMSLSVIGPNVYEADRFATAAFAMGRAGILFIEQLPGFEGYMIDKHGIATSTSQFDRYTKTYAQLD
jgi:thiamine biosynthesis lipoprotein